MERERIVRAYLLLRQSRSLVAKADAAMDKAEEDIKRSRELLATALQLLDSSADECGVPPTRTPRAYPRRRSPRPPRSR